MIRLLGWLHLAGGLAFALLIASGGDDSTCAPAAERSDGPPCEACGQPISW